MNTPLDPLQLESGPQPIACSLDAAGMIDRRAEFDSLFGASLVSLTREPSELRITLAVPPAAEQPVRDLFRREQECCPFFTFGFVRSGELLLVTIGVPDGADTILDAFAEMAAGATRLGA